MNRFVGCRILDVGKGARIIQSELGIVVNDLIGDPKIKELLPAVMGRLRLRDRYQIILAACLANDECWQECTSIYNLHM